MRKIKGESLILTLLALLISSVFALAFMVGCGENPPVKESEVTGVTLDKSAYIMNVGDEFTLIVTVTPDTASNKAVKWSVTKGDAVTVQDGKVTAVKSGDAVVTAIAEDGGANASCAVTVKDKITSIVFDTTEKTIAVGEDFTITPTVTPSALVGDLVWSSEPAGIVKVVGGKVTALAVGTAKVTAVDRTGAVKAECAVTVETSASIELDVTDKTLKIGEKLTLNATVSPENITDTPTWSVEPVGIVSVENGVVTAVKEGKATITASIRGGAVKATCAITVQDPTITLDITSKTINIDETLTLTATVLPDTVTETPVWSVEPAGIVSVENGVVTGLTEGTATVTAGIRDGAIKVTCTVTVELDMTITLDITEKSLHIGDEFTIMPTIMPASQANLISWSVEQTDEFVSVANGKVTALKEGTAVVKASAVGGKFHAECTVTVLPDNYVVLDKQAHTMYIGDTLQLEEEHTPQDATVVWSINTGGEGVVTVENGLVTAVAKGMATVTATLQGKDVSASCVFTIKDPTEIEAIAFAQSAYTFRLRDTLEIPVVFTPASSEAGKTVTYTSNHEGVVTVDADGKVTIVAAGKAKITATVGDFTAECDITVNTLKNDYMATITYDETTGLPTVYTADTGIAVNTLDTGKNTGEYVYYAEATISTKQIGDGSWGMGIGMMHAGDINCNVNNADFMYDKLHMYSWSATNVGYWHRQSKNYEEADDQLSLNIFNDKMGNCYNDVVSLFNENKPVRFGIARDHDFVYSFINRTIIERMPILASLKNSPTFPGLYFNGASGAVNNMSGIKYLAGDEAKAVIESSNVAFRYSRTADGYKSAEIADDGLSAQFNNFTSDYWKSSVSASGSFDGNTEMEFDLAVNSGANGHIFINVSATPLTMDYNTNIGDGENTVVAGGIWVSDNKMNGNDIYQDTATDTGDGKTYDGITGAPTSVHVKITLVMADDGIITSTIVMTNGEAVVYNKTQTSTKTYIGKDFRIHFLSESQIDYTVSNFKFACREAAEATPPAPDEQ